MEEREKLRGIEEVKVTLEKSRTWVARNSISRSIFVYIHKIRVRHEPLIFPGLIYYRAGEGLKKIKGEF